MAGGVGHEAIVERLLARPAPAPGWVAPSYDGFGIANVMPSIMRAFGVETPYPGLAPEVLPPAWLDGVERVVLLIVDALGYDQVRAAVAGEARLSWDELARRPEVVASALTSVFPSTTTAALPTLHTGAPPSIHGGLGFTLYLPEYGAVTEMIRFGPFAGAGSFMDTGADPTAFLRAPVAFPALAAAGVAGYSINYAGYRGSWLTRVLSQGAAWIPYNTFAELCVRVRRLIEAPTPERMLVVAYYGSLDAIAHFRAAGSPEHAAEIAALDATLRRELLDRVRRPRTLLLLVADHGHLDCPLDAGIDLMAHPALLDAAPIVAGEPRARYLYLRPGATREADAYLADHFAGQLVTLDSRDAYAAGLFGPPADAPNRLLARLGDRLLLPLGDAWLSHQLPEGRPPVKMIGRHGNLDRREMLVPLLAVRLD